MPPAETARRAPRGAAVLLLAVVLVSHAPALLADYVQDDLVAVKTSPVVRRADPVEIFTSSYWKGAQGDDKALFRPVTVESYAVEVRVCGDPTPWVSHAVNVLLHFAAAWLLGLWALRLGLPFAASALASLLFAVHPAPSEAVFNVVGRAEILATLFTLAGALAFTYSAPWPAAEGGNPRPTPFPRLAAWTTALSLFLAVGSKEGGIVLAGLLPLQEILFRPPHRGELPRWILDRTAALAPCLLALVVWVILRTVALEAFFPLQNLPVFDNVLVGMSPDVRLWTALGLVARYARLMVWPWPLSHDYSGSTIGVEGSPFGLLPSVGVLVLAGAVALAFRAFSARASRLDSPLPVAASSRRRRIGLAAALLLGSYLVTANLLFPVGAALAERFLYLPAAGLSLLLAAAAAPHLGPAAAPATRRYLLAAFAVMLTLLASVGFRRAFDWRNEVSIFRSATLATPLSPRSHFALGAIATRGIDDTRSGGAAIDTALRHFAEALRLWPDYHLAVRERGLLFARQGDLASAEAVLHDSVRRVPEDGTAHYNLGQVLDRRGRHEEAEREFRKAVLWDPDLNRGWASLGHRYFETARYREAAIAYERAVALGRDDLVARLEESRSRARGEIP